MGKSVSIAYIYHLLCPNTGACVYVGQTEHPKQRKKYWENNCRNANQEMRLWLKSIRKKPVFRIIKTVKADRKLEFELKEIIRQKKQGYAQFNLVHNLSSFGLFTKPQLEYINNHSNQSKKQ